MLSERMNVGERDAQVGRQAGDDGAVPSRVEIQCECAFTYMNAVFRKNLTDALAVDANHVDTASDTAAHLAMAGTERGSAGRQRHASGAGTTPYQLKHGAVIGGWQRGSFTPQMPPSLLLTAAPTATRAAKSAALPTRAKLLIVRDIAKCDMPSRSRGQRVGQTNTR
jgi:hypothetical protein